MTFCLLSHNADADELPSYPCSSAARPHNANGVAAPALHASIPSDEGQLP